MAHTELHWDFGHSAHRITNLTAQSFPDHPVSSENALHHHVQWSHMGFGPDDHEAFLAKHYTFSLLLIIMCSTLVLAAILFVMCRLFKLMEAMKQYWIKDSHTTKEPFYRMSMVAQDDMETV